MNWVIRAVILGSLGASLAGAFAQSDSAIGKWKTFDDKTGQAKSIVQITEENGELIGKVLEVLDPAAGPHPLCKPCDGQRKDQPVEGMTILWGAKRDGASWDDGQILDPENGKIYRVTLTLLDGGQKLEVHGYIGISVIGRSQIWQRQGDNDLKPVSSVTPGQ